MTVAHLDDAIKSSTQPLQHQIVDLSRDIGDLRDDIANVLRRLDARPVRRAVRWVLSEARSLHAAAAGAVVSAGATYAVFHFLT